MELNSGKFEYLNCRIYWSNTATVIEEQGLTVRDFGVISNYCVFKAQR